MVKKKSISRRKQWGWVWVPPKVKFDLKEKTDILILVQKIVAASKKLKKKVSRINMLSNRVYLYHLEKQFRPKGAILIKPLIDDKYLEFPYARITLNDKDTLDCTVDWQRHNDKWMSLCHGTLRECFSYIINNNGWFS